MAYKLSSQAVSFSFPLFSVKVPCANKVNLFSCFSVFCQFNSQAPVTEHKRIKEIFFHPNPGDIRTQ